MYVVRCQFNVRGSGMFNQIVIVMLLPRTIGVPAGSVSCNSTTIVKSCDFAEWYQR